jgi:DNA-binding MarR family transcriptional regulator
VGVITEQDAAGSETTGDQPADVDLPAVVEPDELARLLDDDRITDYGRLVEASGRLARVLAERLRVSTGLAIPVFEVMLRLGRSDCQRLRMSELADQLSLTTGGATRLIDRVVAQGLVEKRACPEDRRVQWVTLTAEGRQRLAEAAPLHLDDLQREFVDLLDPADLPALRRSLDRLRFGDRPPRR